MLILTFNRLPCSYFWFFAKAVLLRVVHPLKIYQNTQFRGPKLKFYINLKSFNVRHFGMVAATSLNIMASSHLQWNDLPTEFHKNLPIDSEVDRRTDRQTHRDLPALFPVRRKVCCGLSSPLKIHRLGRVRTRNLWVQWQAHEPLHHRGDSYGCKNWSLALREEHRLRVFENSERRGEILTVGWKWLHSGGLSPILHQILSGWRNACKMLVVKHESKIPLTWA
jgi:hypothetical protein